MGAGGKSTSGHPVLRVTSVGDIVDPGNVCGKFGVVVEAVLLTFLSASQNSKDVMQTSGGIHCNDGRSKIPRAALLPAVT